ncbi:uncharacterized protein LOC133734368 [Rosa rugosa]|uniref:uncharacterized protein LOC133734368 n=1 Tax=Rosa rugosa TaxID=74645 RepID=UPI002B412D4D|nr:uncharacterized protein LOC133734368 [Rosa rugosa]
MVRRLIQAIDEMTLCSRGLRKTSRLQIDAERRLCIKQQSETPDAISRSDVWLRAYEAKQKKGSTEEAVDSEIVKQVKKYKEEEETVSGLSSIKNDVVAKVLGPDPRGRVRGYGFGALPSKVNAQSHVSNKVTMLENALAAQTQVVDKLQEMVRGLCARLDQGGNNNEHTIAQQSATEIGNRKRKENPSVTNTGSNIAQSKQKDASVRSSYNETENGSPMHQSFNGKKQLSGQVNPKIVHKTDLGKQVQLLSWFAKEEVVVACASIISKDPQVEVHHVPLGHDCWKVSVHEVFHDIALYRPTREFSKLYASIGSMIAWPIKYIKVN